MIESVAEYLSQQLAHIFNAIRSPGQRIFWLYLLSALAIASVVLARQRRRAGRNEIQNKSIMKQIFDPEVWLHRSAVIDYFCFAINTLVAPFIRLAGLAGGALVAAPLYAGMLLMNGGGALGLDADGHLLAIYTLFSLVVLDFGKFTGHYMTHRISWLWELHKVHHSAQVLTPITVYRTHPFDVMLVDLTKGLALGVSGAIGLFVFGNNVNPITILGLNAGTFIFLIIGANLRHSHVWIPYPSWLSHILISPAQHQIHHSSLVEHHDRNFGSIFAFWDWMFGTLYVPERQEDLTFGLVGDEDRDYQTVRNLYFEPLRKIWRRFRGTNNSKP